MLLPREIFPADVFVEFGFHCLKRGKLAQVGVGNLAGLCGEHFPGVEEAPAESEDVGDCLEPGFTGDEDELVPLTAQHRRMEELGIPRGGKLDRSLELFELLRVEFATLTVGGDGDGGKLGDVHDCLRRNSPMNGRGGKWERGCEMAGKIWPSRRANGAGRYAPMRPVCHSDNGP